MKSIGKHLLLPIVGLLCVGISACSGSDSAPLSTQELSKGPKLDYLSGPCEGDSQRDCSITLEQKNGIISCFRGTQNCEDGKWGQCGDGKVTEEVDPNSAQLRDFKQRNGLALTDPIACSHNACDPSCMWYDENPDDIGAGGAGSGALSLPTLPTCAHALCTEGKGLADDCDPCVTTVCATQPSCCDESDPNAWSSECANLVAPLCTFAAPSYELCDFAALSLGDISVATNSTISGGAIGATSASLSNLSSGEEIVVDGAIDLGSGSYGSSVYSSALISESGASYDPAKAHEGLTVSLPTLPVRSVSCTSSSGSTQTVGANTVSVSPGNGDTYQLNNNSSKLILSGPGAYGTMVISANATVIFDGAGTYSFDNFSITAGSPTLLLPSSGKVNVETCAGLALEGAITVQTYSKVVDSCSATPSLSTIPLGNWVGANLKFLHNGVVYTAKSGHSRATNKEPGVGATWTSVWESNPASANGPKVCLPYSYTASGSAAEDLKLLWYSNALGTIPLAAGALSGSALLAPSATVELLVGNHRGLVYAGDLQLQADANLDSSALVGSACVATGLGSAASAGSCPVDVLTPLLNEPCSTGRDCQVNHRCEEPDSGSCSHNKCLPGDALDAGCDECVERVCAVSPECCTDGWDESCVAQVATVCDAVCDDYSCLHPGCEIGVPLEIGICDSCVDTVCSTSGFEDCCTNNWSNKCTIEYRQVCGAAPVVTNPTAGGSLCDYSAFGKSQLQVNYATLTGGWVGSPDNGSLFLVNSTVNGDLTSSASLNASGSTVNGDYVTGAASSVPPSTVTGSVIVGVPPSPTLPSKNITGCTTGADPRSGVLAPGSYGDVTVADGQTLTLQGGQAYTFNSLTLGAGGSGAVLEIPSDGSVVEINVCSNVIFDVNSDMVGLTQATAMNVSIYAEKGYIAAYGNNQLYGFLIAKLDPANPGYIPGPCVSGCNLASIPPGSIFLGEKSQLLGLGAGERRLDVRGNPSDTSFVAIDSTGVKDNCELIWDPGGIVTWPTCANTYTANLPGESAVCTYNQDGYKDLSCSGYDLALGIPCDDEISVCNHGTVDFSGTVEVGYWDVGLKVVANPAPSTSPDGICSQSMSISAGTCEVLTCASLPSADVTLMVDPENKVNECDSRRLDNWSMFDGQNCSVAASVTETQLYEAICPDNSRPSWGYLGWSTSTPGSSSVDFRVALGKSAAALASSPSYSTVAVAEASSNNQVCGFSSSCAVGITDTLALGDYQDSFLQLEMKLNPAGVDMPLLMDWRLSYSCIVDQ